MQYLKRNTKYGIFAFLIIVLSIIISISTLAKTEVYPACAYLHADRFSLYGNPQILSTTSPKLEVQTININTASQDDLVKIFKISEPVARKIIDLPFMSFPRTRESIILREELGGFKEPEDLLQLPGLVYFGWREWEEEGVVITFN